MTDFDFSGYRNGFSGLSDLEGPYAQVYKTSLEFLRVTVVVPCVENFKEGDLGFHSSIYSELRTICNRLGVLAQLLHKVLYDSAPTPQSMGNARRNFEDLLEKVGDAFPALELGIHKLSFDELFPLVPPERVGLWVYECENCGARFAYPPLFPSLRCTDPIGTCGGFNLVRVPARVKEE